MKELAELVVVVVLSAAALGFVVWHFQHRLD